MLRIIQCGLDKCSVIQDLFTHFTDLIFDIALKLAH